MRAVSKREVWRGRELFEIQADSLAQVGERIADGVALGGRAGGRVVGDVAAFGGERKNRLAIMVAHCHVTDVVIMQSPATPTTGELE